MQDLPDATLMELAARGRAGAFEALVRRHERLVSGLAARFTGNRTDAEDLAQEVFLRVYEAAPRWRPEAAFTTWLYRVTANACLSFGKRRRPAPVDGLDALPGPAPAADELMARAEEREAVGRAVQALPENQRLALILKRFEGRSHREIAEAMGTTVAAVESLIQRAYEGLRERLKDRIPEKGAGKSPARC
ncbi:MAG: sigma-70 family RNA polymerase sigma factor [Planctomycetes bacterium]|nr:sigma-70 family RNA polymerase sigma factor [Planctomycetota bacterium]